MNKFNIILENWRKYANLVEISPDWRAKDDANTDKITPFGHYGALKGKLPQGKQEEQVNDEFVQFAAQNFDRIFKTGGFYTKLTATLPGRRKLIADATITGKDKPYAGDIMHALLHEMILRFSYKQFLKKQANFELYDLWMNIMETIVYYLQNGYSGTNPKPFGNWIYNRIVETIGKDKVPDKIGSNDLYELFMQVFTKGTKDRPGLNQIEQIPEAMRTPFLRDIRKALPRDNRTVNPVEAFTNAVKNLVINIHKGSNSKTFLVDETGKDISNQFLTFYNVLERKAKQLKII
jgi:hypothetical protein